MNGHSPRLGTQLGPMYRSTENDEECSTTPTPASISINMKAKAAFAPAPATAALDPNQPFNSLRRFRTHLSFVRTLTTPPPPIPASGQRFHPLNANSSPTAISSGTY